jgi:hypothetical protein
VGNYADGADYFRFAKGKVKNYISRDPPLKINQAGNAAVQPATQRTQRKSRFFSAAPDETQIQNRNTRSIFPVTEIKRPGFLCAKRSQTVPLFFVAFVASPREARFCC